MKPRLKKQTPDYPASVLFRGHMWSGFSLRYLKIDLAEGIVTLYEEDRAGNPVHTVTVIPDPEDLAVFRKTASLKRLRRFEEMPEEIRSKQETGERPGWRMEYAGESFDGTPIRGKLGAVYRNHPMENLMEEIKKRISESAGYLM